MLLPATASHDPIIKLAAYEHSGVREVWRVHPGDRVVSVYLLGGGMYGRANMRELEGTLALASIPDLTIDWAQVSLT